MKAKLFIVFTMCAALSLNSAAQDRESRFGFELSGGPSFATSEFAEGIRMGFGFDGAFHYRLLNYTGVYAGWGANWFTTETSSSNTNRDYEETGYVLGLQFMHPIKDDRSSYFLRAGVLYNHIEVENDNGDILEDTGHGPGFQLAAGVSFDLGSAWSIAPVMKFNYLTRPLDSEENSAVDTNFNYITLRIGIQKMF